mmetsp:Transcript_25969/g.76116  ORF Transcript_25969/g.76116 Transcript_25969/m.76116 type:complete len:204 (+) Transcript_25969:163-774(+)
MVDEARSQSQAQVQVIPGGINVQADVRRGMLERRRLLCGDEVCKRALEERSHITVADDHEAAAVVAPVEHEVLVNPQIELVQRGHHVGVADDGRAALVDGVEYGVAQELEEVAVTRLRPCGVVGELGALVDKPELDEEAGDAPVLRLRARAFPEAVALRLQRDGVVHEARRDEREHGGHGGPGGELGGEVHQVWAAPRRHEFE